MEIISILSPLTDCKKEIVEKEERRERYKENRDTKLEGRDNTDKMKEKKGDWKKEK